MPHHLHHHAHEVRRCRAGDGRGKEGAWWCGRRSNATVICWRRMQRVTPWPLQHSPSASRKITTCKYGHGGHPAWKEAVSQVAHLLVPSAHPRPQFAQTARRLRTALQAGNGELGMLGGMQAVCHDEHLYAHSHWRHAQCHEQAHASPALARCGPRWRPRRFAATPRHWGGWTAATRSAPTAAGRKARAVRFTRRHPLGRALCRCWREASLLQCQPAALVSLHPHQISSAPPAPPAASPPHPPAAAAGSSTRSSPRT